MSVYEKRGYLYINFRCFTPTGEKTRCQEATGFKDTKKNRQVVSDKDKAVKYALRTNTFDYLRFFPHGARASLFRSRPETMTLSQWWDEWISEKVLRQNTDRNWASAYRVHIGPHFGHMLLSEITEHEVLVFRQSLEKKLKASSVNDKIIKPLCMALRKAYKRGLMAEYVCADIGRLDEDRVDIDPFTPEELNALLSFLETYRNPMFYDLFFVWTRTGLRPGEMYALKWGRIDYFNGKLLVRETRYPSGQEGPPKTKHSVRDVKIGQATIDALKRQEARTRLAGAYVWLTNAGKPFSDAFMRKKFSHILTLAKLKYRPPKQMRHTFATLHLAAGENPKFVSAQLGHASTKITHEKYERFVPNLTRDDGSAFEKMMAQKAGFGNHRSTRLRK